MSARQASGAGRSLLMLAVLAVTGAANVGASRTMSAPAALAEHNARPAEHRSPSGLALTRQVIASGGGQSSGGVFALQGTIGQLDAEPLHPASGGVYAISGGFWPGLLLPATPGVDPIFANGFEPLPP